MHFDATTLYPSAICDEISVYPKIEIGYALELHMDDMFVNDFKNQTFIKDGNDSAILKKTFTIHLTLYFNI